jgi:RNA polymerase sigma-70 factor (ECF subfamily)
MLTLRGVSDISRYMSAQGLLFRIGERRGTKGVNLQEAVIARSRAEIVEAIRSLSAADWVRLKKIAAYYARPAIPAPDLLQEAFVRALDGSRVCPAHVDAVRFLAEAMRSIANGEQDKADRRPTLVPIEGGSDVTAAMNFPDPTPGAEFLIAQAEQEARMRADLLALFDDDLAAKDIVEGTMEGMTAEDLRELTGLDKTAYASKRKLIRRRIDKNYPEGWQP